MTSDPDRSPSTFTPYEPSFAEPFAEPLAPLPNVSGSVAVVEQQLAAAQAQSLLEQAQARAIRNAALRP